MSTFEQKIPYPKNAHIAVRAAWSRANRKWINQERERKLNLLFKKHGIT